MPTPTITPSLVYFYYPPVIDVQFQLQFLAACVVMAVVNALVFLVDDTQKSLGILTVCDILGMGANLMFGVYSVAVFMFALLCMFLIRAVLGLKGA